MHSIALNPLEKGHLLELWLTESLQACNFSDFETTKIAPSIAAYVKQKGNTVLTLLSASLASHACAAFYCLAPKGSSQQPTLKVLVAQRPCWRVRETRCNNGSLASQEQLCLLLLQ